MKFLKYLAFMLVAIVVVVYATLFTGFGNGILRPIIEKKIQEASGVDVALQKFHLTLGDIAIILDVAPKNRVLVHGTYSLFSQKFNLEYRVDFQELERLQKIAKTPLSGVFRTNGSVRGDLDFITVDGKSDVANSQTTYHVELTHFQPSSIIATIAHLQVQELLVMIGENKFVSANLDAKIDFKSIKPHALDGEITLHTTHGRFNPRVIQKAVGIKIPKTTFTMNSQAKLKGDAIDYDYTFNSNLAKITTNGHVVPQPLLAKIHYDLSIKELALLQPLTKTLLRGSLNAHGDVVGDQKKMQATLFSDLANSKTRATLSLENLKPKTLQASISNLHLQKLLYMLNQPHYTDALFSMKASISNLEVGSLRGKVTTHMQGALDNRFLTKEYDFKHPMPKSHFTLETTTHLQDSLVVTQTKLHSNLASLTTHKSSFNLKDGTFKSDYTVKVPSLEKLFFVTDKHLRGGFETKGELRKDAKLHLKGSSNIAKGELLYTLDGDLLHLDLNDMRTKKVLWVLRYPELFDGGVFAKLDYNLKDQKGELEANFKDGLFVKNKIFDTLKHFGHVDLYKEYFSGKALAKIDKEHIAAQYNLQSRKTVISSKKTLLSTKKSTIDAKIRIELKKTPVDVTLKGAIAKPTIGVDLKAFVKSEAGKKLEKKLEKKVEKKFGKDVSNLLKGLF